VQKAEQEKLAAIIRSEGESEAAKILTSALTVGPALLELRRLEAAKEIASTLARSPNFNDCNLLRHRTRRIFNGNCIRYLLHRHGRDRTCSRFPSYLYEYRIRSCFRCLNIERTTDHRNYRWTSIGINRLILSKPQS
jgi:hypothetical protein